MNLVYYYLINRHTYSHLPNMCQSWDIGLCSVVNGEKFQCHAATLTLIGQCPTLNSFELFSFTRVCLIFKWIEPLFFELSCTQTDTHTDLTDRQTDRHECSIVFNRNYNKAYTCLCLSKSDAIERIKNAKCESSLRCLTWRKPTQEIFGKERHKPDAGKKRLVGAQLYIKEQSQ